ncbi:MAG TPA: N(4)-(beta-N-acetylglucosaminyl)-L-asparaginase [Planctomycetota bacterium]|jgi:N4-(beta-N-acetylglucosaminyl)-L-asparaginase|nr:N(4)-(beta-N-acetylglucosaminyl)-L-asparaginase [Planctomycetota bacterium]
MLTRREFIAASAAATAAVRRPSAPATLPAVITTWDFGKAANAEAWAVLEAGGRAIDAVEKGVNQAEMDPGNTSVGFGGLPDEDGEVTNDAILFWGPPHAVGAVGGMKRIKRPISVARKVMEKTKHTLLVGDDATRFAVKMGWKEEELLTEKARKIWQAWKENPNNKGFWNHDTIGMVAVDKDGDLCAGTSTSGLAFKIKGRVGDVAIPGAGAYVDNDVGGVAATGNGDIMMRFGLALMAVEYMRSGASPTDACARSLQRIEAKGYRVQACLVALSKKGEFGAARIGFAPFPFAIRNGSVDEVRRV